MPIHTPHYPDLLFDAAARLRRWEDALMGLLAGEGFRELHPSLVLREPVTHDTIQFFDQDERVALRWDFTLALARQLARRFTEPPPRVSYAGAVFRRPRASWEPVERFEVGCERIQTDAAGCAAADVDLARLLMAVPRTLGLKGGILQLGHAALMRIPMALEGLDPEREARVVQALARRAPHRVREALGDHPAAARLTRHAEALLSELDGPETLKALDGSPYAEAMAEDRAHLGRAIAALTPLLPPGLELRVDLADVQGLGFYTGPTLRLWAPGARQELAAGGRYDGLFPQLGRPWFAAGFCVRLTPLLDLAETRPELFENGNSQ
jgi:ATP phosphoribosyltransferase regulatory subunit HisZ